MTTVWKPYSMETFIFTRYRKFSERIFVNDAVISYCHKQQTTDKKQTEVIKIQKM